jgi:hypothetical protein
MSGVIAPIAQPSASKRFGHLRQNGAMRPG